MCHSTTSIDVLAAVEGNHITAAHVLVVLVGSGVVWARGCDGGVVAPPHQDSRPKSWCGGAVTPRIERFTAALGVSTFVSVVLKSLDQFA